MKFEKSQSLNFKKSLHFEEKILSWLIAVLSIMSCAPVVFAGVDTIMIIGLSILYFFVLFFNFFKRRKVLIDRAYFLVLLFGFFLLFFVGVPFRDFDRVSPFIIWYVIFCSLFFLSRGVLIQGFRILTKLVFVICICAILVLICNVLGIQLPSSVVEREFGSQQYINYYFSSKLNGQDYYLFGLELYRLSGIFREPGHFGMVLLMFLYVYSDFSRTFVGRVFIITAILTLSFGAYLMLIILLLKRVLFERDKWLLLFLSICVTSVFVYLPDEFITHFFLNKADEALEGRTTGNLSLVYKEFIKSIDIFWGKGKDVLSYYDIIVSDYRGYFLRYGVFGILLNCGLLFSLIFRKGGSIILLTSVYFIIVFLHRSWFLDYFAFLFAVLMMTYGLKYKKKVSVIK